MRAKQIRELVRIVEESNIGELEVTKWWGNKVRIRKEHGSVQSAIAPTVTTSSSTSQESVESRTVPTVAPQEDTVAASTPPVGSDNLVEIKSPMVGTFYRAPAPDAAPYVEVGDPISPGKVLCIIEAMKLMNEIEAEISGKIVEILVENAQPVEYNQVLFKIQP